MLVTVSNAKNKAASPKMLPTICGIDLAARLCTVNSSLCCSKISGRPMCVRAAWSSYVYGGLLKSLYDLHYYIAISTSYLGCAEKLSNMQPIGASRRRLCTPGHQIGFSPPFKLSLLYICEKETLCVWGEKIYHVPGPADQPWAIKTGTGNATPAFCNSSFSAAATFCRGSSMVAAMAVGCSII